MGITFGDYLRAVVTGDHDLNPDDEIGYRLAFVESFRQWGIHPEGMRSMSVDSLLWPSGEDVGVQGPTRFDPGAQRFDPHLSQQAGRPELDRLQPWNLDSDRYKTWEGAEDNAEVVWNWLMTGTGRALLPVLGLEVHPASCPPTVFRSRSDPTVAAVEVHSVRTAIRRGSRGGTVSVLVIEITQRRRGYFDRKVQEQMDEPDRPEPTDDPGDFSYRAGCTVLVDAATLEVRRIIRTPGTIHDTVRLERMRKFLVDGGLEPANAFDRARDSLSGVEPFALLHRHGEG